jgi:hypothetical protein
VVDDAGVKVPSLARMGVYGQSTYVCVYILCRVYKYECFFHVQNHQKTCGDPSKAKDTSWEEEKCC